MNLEDLITPEPMSGCWLWSGCVTADGLPRFRKERAQRAIYQSASGQQLRDREQVRAKCGNRVCMNPIHLYRPSVTEDDRIKCEVVGCNRKRRHGYGKFCDVHWQGAAPCQCGCGRFAVGRGFLRGHRRKYQNEDEAIEGARTIRGKNLRAYTATRRGWLISKRGWFAHQLKVKYGLTVEDFAWMWERSGHACEICRRPLLLDGGEGPMRGRNDRPHVDHCHDTGAVRGILCRGCNHGVGNMDDDPERLLLAAAYLRQRTP